MQLKIEAKYSQTIAQDGKRWCNTSRSFNHYEAGLLRAAWSLWVTMQGVVNGDFWPGPHLPSAGALFLSASRRLPIFLTYNSLMEL